MRFHEEASRSAYDVVVVGSGMGGLTAAALLARAGRSVLVVERHYRVGGYAHAFRRGRYWFDSAVHMVGGCDSEPERPSGLGEGPRLLEQILSVGGQGAGCDFVPVDPCYRVRFPEFGLDVPTGVESFIATHAKLFPEEEGNLRAFMAECAAVRAESDRSSELRSVFDVMKIPDQFPALLRYRRSTLAEVLDAHFEAPGLKAALSALWPYVGLPPSRVSFLYFATMLLSYVADGAYYCKGSFQGLANTLAEGVTQRGGEVLLRTSVRRIRVREGRAVGITLENGQEIDAPAVISNADLSQTVSELVGTEWFNGRYRRDLERLKPSVSAVVLYLALRCDPAGWGLVHENFFYPSFDHDRHAAGMSDGEAGWFSLTVPTLSDPGLAPPGDHLMNLTVLVEPDAVKDWKAAKPTLTDCFLRLAESELPGFRDAVVFSECATPRTMERYTRNESGALYGWELSPGQVGTGRPANASPLPGLFLAGHWAQPGGGVYGVARSGVRAARSVLGHTTDSEFWSALGA